MMIMEISLARIVSNPYQARKPKKKAVAELAESISHNGLMQPPTARRVANGFYQLAFGHTRFEAFKLLNMETMPLIVRELTDLEMFEMCVAENVKRRDMNAIEEAEAMRRYMDDFKKTSIEAGQFFGVKDVTVRNKVRLLKLPEEEKEKLERGEITEGMGRALLAGRRVARKTLPPMKAEQPVRTNINHFDALAMIGGKALQDHVERAVIKTCEACALYATASPTTCRDCPLPEFLKRL